MNKITREEAMDKALEMLKEADVQSIADLIINKELQAIEIENKNNKFNKIKDFAEENKMGHLGQFARNYILKTLKE